MDRTTKAVTKKNKLVLLVLALVCFGAVLVACAPKQVAEEPIKELNVELSAWTKDSDCASCHVAEEASGTNTACAYSQHTAVKCITCHSDDGGQMVKAHEKYASAKIPTKLKKSSINVAICESCHNASELKTITASLTVLSDSNGTVINPHDLPVTEGHEGAITCSSCHKLHSADPVADTAKKTCLSCHHAGVFECGTCHE